MLEFIPNSYIGDMGSPDIQLPQFIDSQSVQCSVQLREVIEWSIPMRGVVTRLIMVCVLAAPGLVGAQQSKDDGAAMPRIFEVVSRVYRSLDRQLKSSEPAGQNSESEEARKWSSDIRNYDIEIMEYGGRIYATFSLRPFKGVRFNGGVHHYVLDETTGGILEHNAER